MLPAAVGQVAASHWETLARKYNSIAIERLCRRPAELNQHRGIEMSGDVRDRVAEIGPSPRSQDNQRWVKTYTYLRTTIVALLIALGVAVFYESGRQGFLLASVSAYYYTPAQAIFVGALIGLAACMIALNGTFGFEEVFLNLGGMFAAVVAIVPTSRGEDYQTAVRACRQLLTEQELSDLKCSDFLGLAEATKANVQNNMVALLLVGFLG